VELKARRAELAALAAPAARILLSTEDLHELS